jgi:hypothetical protein
MPYFKDVLEEGNRIGQIVAGPTEDGYTKANNPWKQWDVVLDDGFATNMRTYGERGNDQAQENIGKDQEFYLKGGFINFKAASGERPSVAPQATPKPQAAPSHTSSPNAVEQSVWDRKDRESNRSIALSYAKDLCVADIIKFEAILESALSFVNFIQEKPERKDEDLSVPF